MTHKINIPRIQKQRHYANASDEIICFVFWGKNYYYCSPPLGLKRRIRYDVTRVSRRLCSTLTNLIVGCHEPKHSLLWIWRIEKMSCALCSQYFVVERIILSHLQSFSRSLLPFFSCSDWVIRQDVVRIFHENYPVDCPASRKLSSCHSRCWDRKWPDRLYQD